MVMLTLAAAGAAAAGIFKGGEAAAKKTKNKMRERRFEKKQDANATSLKEKKRDRSERMAKIEEMRRQASQR